MEMDVWLERPTNGRLPRRLRMRLGVLFGLLFLSGPISDLAHSRGSTAPHALYWAGLAAFVALYVAMLPPGRRLAGRPALEPAGLAVLAALAVGLLAAGAPHSFAALFVYVVAAAGLVLAPRWAAAVTVATSAAVAIGGKASGASGAATASIALTTLSIGALMTAFGHQVRINAELREAREELARHAVDEERLRIARDLHDLLGHTLSLIALKTELASKLVDRDAEQAKAELAEVHAVTRQALAEVREALHGYRQLALGEALDGARSALAAAGIDCRVEGEDVALPGEVETVLAWAVREAATNVVRHSGASSCSIRLHAEESEVELEVADDGAGGGEPAGGSGLTGLAERAARLHGHVEAGRSGGGFRVSVVVPLR